MIDYNQCTALWNMLVLCWQRGIKMNKQFYTIFSFSFYWVLGLAILQEVLFKRETNEETHFDSLGMYILFVFHALIVKGISIETFCKTVKGSSHEV